jgi:hypothetical protein
MLIAGIERIASPCFPKGLHGRALQLILVTEFLCNELF